MIGGHHLIDICTVLPVEQGLEVHLAPHHVHLETSMTELHLRLENIHPHQWESTEVACLLLATQKIAQDIGVEANPRFPPGHLERATQNPRLAILYRPPHILEVVVEHVLPGMIIGLSEIPELSRSRLPCFRSSCHFDIRLAIWNHLFSTCPSAQTSMHSCQIIDSSAPDFKQSVNFWLGCRHLLKSPNLAGMWLCVYSMTPYYPLFSYYAEFQLLRSGCHLEVG